MSKEVKDSSIILMYDLHQSRAHVIVYLQQQGYS